jgi:hypothetical protein
LIQALLEERIDEGRHLRTFLDYGISAIEVAPAGFETSRFLSLAGNTPEASAERRVALL